MKLRSSEFKNILRIKSAKMNPQNTKKVLKAQQKKKLSDRQEQILKVVLMNLKSAELILRNLVAAKIALK